MAEGPRGNVLTGARGRLLVAGHKIGYATAVSVNQEIEVQPIEPIDTIAVEEHVPTAYRVSWTASFGRIVNDERSQRMWFANLEELVRGGTEISMQLFDKVSGTVIAHLEGVQVTSNNLRLGGRSIAGREVTGVARACMLETQPTFVSTDVLPA